MPLPQKDPMDTIDIDKALAEPDDQSRSDGAASQTSKEVTSSGDAKPGEEVISPGAGERSDSAAEGENAAQVDPAAGEKSPVADTEAADADATIERLRAKVNGEEKADQKPGDKTEAKDRAKPNEGKKDGKKPAEKAGEKPATIKPEEERFHPAAKATIAALRTEVHSFEQQIRELRSKAKGHDDVIHAADAAGLNSKFVGHVVSLHGKAINGDQQAQEQVYNLLIESGFKAPAARDAQPPAANIDLEALEGAVSALKKGETLDLSLIEFIIAQ
ncbi:hypothetical protein UFOVP141_1, partial [uncultured Caudovirales phage]